MPKLHPVHAALLSCLVAPFLQGASQLDEPTYDDNVYVNCAHRVAAIFPVPPTIKDFTYTSGGMSVPARQFYTQQGPDIFSVTVADFSNGPAIDEKLIDDAAAPFRQKGEIRFQFKEVYDPGIPGRQLNIFQPNGKQLRASVYMADHRLYITESTSTPGDFAALQFEQSVSIINAVGTDLDKNGALPSRQYNCKK